MGVGPRIKLKGVEVDQSVVGRQVKTQPTSNTIPASGPQRKSNSYTGTEIMGIVTAHKSNLMPVSNQKQAEEAAKMRRG
jgi:hypothetical protein